MNITIGQIVLETHFNVVLCLVKERFKLVVGFCILLFDTVYLGTFFLKRLNVSHELFYVVYVLKHVIFDVCLRYNNLWHLFCYPNVFRDIIRNFRCGWAYWLYRSSFFKLLAFIFLCGFKLILLLVPFSFCCFVLGVLRLELTHGLFKVLIVLSDLCSTSGDLFVILVVGNFLALVFMYKLVFLPRDTSETDILVSIKINFDM